MPHLMEAIFYWTGAVVLAFCGIQFVFSLYLVTYRWVVSGKKSAPDETGHTNINE